MKPFLLSLYDLTGTWSQPYVDAGWKVMRWDKQVEGCVLKNFSHIIQLIEQEVGEPKIEGLLVAAPCTAFAGSGARWWPEKDDQSDQYFPFNSFTEYMVALTEITFHFVDELQPDFWVLENPVGRIERLVPHIKKYRKMSFDPCDFGDPYTKRTILWGEFNPNLKKNFVEPVEGSKMRNISPSPERANIRSKTPEGFARAFYEANNEQLQFRKQMSLAI